MQVIIIGAGASGMLAAITAAQSPENQVLLLERQSRVGRKLAATGNGRCNLGNLYPACGDYQTDSPEILSLLDTYSPTWLRNYFHALGLVTVDEPDGKLYPYSDQAGSVVDVLRFALERPNLEVRTGCEVSVLLRRRDGSFLVRTADGKLPCDKLILATGGPAGGKLGGVADGQAWAKSLGHTVAPMLPGLVQLKSRYAPLHALKGVRAEAALTLCRHGKEIAQASGEVQFTDYGLSGPAVFALSRAAARSGDGISVQLDLLPQLDFAALDAMLSQRQSTRGALAGESLLAGMLHNRLGKTLVQVAGLSLAAPLASLSGAALAAVARIVKCWEIPIDGTLGFDQAQITIGGVLTADVDAETLESRLCPNLYLCGEVLNVDATCGGFNLQWAWASGRRAGLLGQKENMI
ncbi:MAG: aminoacetone oxidase family FAD-binding enzyme [Oscillospiraceae bacterium]|nr:aminoacetone oxidase family FAD-binding enzyme [Oscillospiraceae bacterium]